MKPGKIINWVKRYSVQILLAVIIIMLIGQQYPIYSTYKTANYRTATPSDAMFAPSGNPYTSGSEMEIRVSLSYKVRNAMSSFKYTKGLIASYHGKILSSNFYSQESGNSWSIEARIPENLSKKFEDDLNIGKLQSRYETGRDILPQIKSEETELSRLRNLKSKLEKLLNSSSDPDAMIKLNNQISSIDRQINQLMENEMRNEARTNYITYTISANEEQSPVAGVFLSAKQYARVFIESVNSGVLTTLKFLGYVLIPGLLLWGIVALIRLF